MKIGGNIGSENFNYVKIELLGCKVEDCFPDKDIIKTSVNFVGLAAAPSLMTGEEDVVTYTQDFTFFKMLDPNRTQSSNFFFMNSVI